MVLGQAWSSYSESYKANGATFDFVIFVVGIVRENQPNPSSDCFGYRHQHFRSPAIGN